MNEIMFERGYLVINYHEMFGLGFPCLQDPNSCVYSMYDNSKKPLNVNICVFSFIFFPFMYVNPVISVMTIDVININWMLLFYTYI